MRIAGRPRTAEQRATIREVKEGLISFEVPRSRGTSNIGQQPSELKGLPEHADSRSAVKAAAHRLSASTKTGPDPKLSLVNRASGLFSDAGQFEVLERELLPPLLADGRLLTVWSAGCGDGADLYSVAIVLERLGALERSFLLGTDRLEENLVAARRGRWGDVEIGAGIRERMRFEHHDVLRDGASRGGWLVIVCRHTGTSLTPEAKRVLHHALATALSPRGILLFGRDDRVDDATGLGLERVASGAYRKRT